MIPVRRAAIIGLGLIGGSIARELAARRIRVSAYDTDTGELDAAQEGGILERVLDASLSGVEDAELVVIAVPVDAAPDVLAQISDLIGGATLVTDVGSTKSRIVAAATELGVGERFVGSHPLAGDHRSGWKASRTGLFVDARVFLCPPPEAGMATINVAAELWHELGARPTLVRADQHDREVAWTSHMPQMVSAALGLTLARAGIPRDDLGPGGRDVTRLAGGSPGMWTAIASENAAEIDAALAAAEQTLAELRGAVGRRDVDALRQHFVEARQWFDANSGTTAS